MSRASREPLTRRCACGTANYFVSVRYKLSIGLGIKACCVFYIWACLRTRITTKFVGLGVKVSCFFSLLGVFAHTDHDNTSFSVPVRCKLSTGLGMKACCVFAFGAFLCARGSRQNVISCISSVQVVQWSWYQGMLFFCIRGVFAHAEHDKT